MARSRIIPYLTEKAVKEAKSGRYTFLVTPPATSGAVAVAVRELYNVQPTTISLVKNAPKRKGLGRTVRVRPARLKAIVTLKKGQKIQDFVIEEGKK